MTSAFPSQRRSAPISQTRQAGLPPSMGGWRNPGDVAPPRALVVNPRLAGLLARGLLSRLERDRTHIREEHFLVRAREDLDGLFQRHPFHRLDVVHRLAPRSADGSHMPKLYDLDSAIYRIQHRTKKSVDRNLVSGFFQHLSSGGSKRALTGIELALWQDPRFVPAQSHDGDARSAAFP